MQPSGPQRSLHRDHRSCPWGILCLVLLVAPVCSLHASPAPHGARRLARIESHLKLLRRSLRRERRARAHIRSLLIQIHHEITLVRASLDQIVHREAALERDVAALHRRRASIRRQWRKMRGSFDTLLRLRDVLGPEARLHLLLGGLHHPGRSERLLRDFTILESREHRRLVILRTTLTRLTLLLTRLEAKYHALALVRARKTRVLLRLAAVRAQRRAMLAALQGRITRHGAIYALLTARARTLEELVGHLDRTLVHIPWASGIPLAFPELRGALPWPAHGSLLRSYGQPRASGVGSWHGIFIGAPRGSPVYAVAHGRVVFAGWMPYFGLLLIVDQGQGYYTIYAHESVLYRRVGDWVNAGSLLGSVGRSGGARRPGLYFSIRRGGTSLDPLHWLVPHASAGAG